jgi:hypothetical protein
MCNKSAWENEAAVATTRARPVIARDHRLAPDRVVDVTADRSPLSSHAEVETLRNFRALIGDPRNGVRVFVNQLHVAFLLARNLLVDRLRDHGVAAPEVFEDARRATMWHYEWVLLYDYLPASSGWSSAGDRRCRRPTATDTHSQTCSRSVP